MPAALGQPRVIDLARSIVGLSAHDLHRCELDPYFHLEQTYLVHFHIFHSLFSTRVLIII